MRFKIIRLFAYLILATISVQCTSTKEVEKERPVAIVPLPMELKQGKGHFVIDKETTIQITGNDAAKVAKYLAAMISASSSFELSGMVGNEAGNDNVIFLEIVEEGKEEGYSLDITEKQIYIKASDAAGLFYGVQTLRQLLPPSIESKDKKATSWSVPEIAIKDQPLYPWRGMHIDVSRHFFSVDFIKKFIDRLALYKFNRLHLHLTDDQGWRIEIKKYPQLTEEGAWRMLNNQDSACIEKSATNSDFALPTEFIKEKDGKKLYGGFYSQEEIRDIVKYASARFITIVPEIDMPGHMKAALNSFPDLSCVDGAGWGKLFSIPLCPCEETTYTFVEDVLKEVAGLFPGEYIHIGADEVEMSTWMKSPQCKGLMKKEGYKTAEELHTYFVNRVKGIVDQLGKKTIGWDEILDGKPDSSVMVMYWRGWVPKAPEEAAKKGHNIVMSPTSHCYFDYEPDSKSLEYTYNFNPMPEGLSKKEAFKIKGLQANIWSEVIPTPARLDYMTMPRMVAIAEIGWSANKDWNDFSSRVSEQNDRWDIMGIKFRLQDIPDLRSHIAFIDTTSLRLTKPEGVREIRYSTDGSEPDSTSTIYVKPVRIDSSVTIKILTIGYKGRSGNRSTIRFEKQQYLPPVKVANVKDGILCKYYIGAYNSVNKFAGKDLKKDTVTREIVIPSFAKANAFGLEYNGLIDIPTDGIYTFYLSSDDGSTLEIGGKMVVNNDSYHAKKEMNGQVALSRGLHPFNLKYFEGGGGGSLKLQYDGPNIKQQELPENLLKIQN